MKILMVDDNAKTKCIGIIVECRRRNIELEIAKASKEAMKKVYVDEGKTIDGIILDMNMPKEPQTEPIRKEGENVLRKFLYKKINIPVLIFSDEDVNQKYDQVFDHMKDWRMEKYKFYNFLEKLLEKKDKRNATR